MDLRIKRFNVHLRESSTPNFFKSGVSHIIRCTDLDIYPVPKIVKSTVMDFSKDLSDKETFVVRRERYREKIHPLKHTERGRDTYGKTQKNHR